MRVESQGSSHASTEIPSCTLGGNYFMWVDTLKFGSYLEEN